MNPLPTAPQMKRFIRRCDQANEEITEAIGSIRNALKVFDADSISIMGNPFTIAASAAERALGALEAASCLLAHASTDAEEQRKMARKLARASASAGKARSAVVVGQGPENQALQRGEGKQ